MIIKTGIKTIFGCLLVLSCNLINSGCKSYPLYGSAQHHPAAGKLLESVRVNRIDGRTGQLLRNHLFATFNHHNDIEAKYELNVTLARSQRNLLYNPDATTARVEEEVSAKLKLIELNSGKTVGEGEIRLDTSMSNIINNPHIYYLTQDTSFLLEKLAHQIKTQVIVWLHSCATTAAVSPPHEN